MPIVVTGCVAHGAGPTDAHGQDMPVYVTRSTISLPQLKDGSFRLQRGFRLEKGARDGGPWWYYVRLRFKLLYGSDPGRGSTVVTASVNHLTSNRVEIKRHARARCTGGESIWNSVDLLRGFVKRRACGPVLKIRSVNFVQHRSIRPGPAALIVQAIGGLGDGDAMTLLPGSGLFRSRLGPAMLGFASFDPVGDLSAGKWTRLTFHMANRGGRTARRVTVAASAGEGLSVKPKRARLPAVPPHGETTGGIWVKPREEGEFRLVLSASSTANHPGTELSLATDADEGTGVRDAAMAVAVSGLLGLLLVWKWGRRREVESGR